MNHPLFSITITQNNNQITLGQQDVADLFQHLYHSSRVWQDTYFLGHHILKCPLDLWIYQEMIFEIKPDVIIETGTFHGASALYLASLCDIVGNGEIITIDIDLVPNRPQHPENYSLHGSSTASNIVEQVRNRITEKETILVILDSDHSKAHVDEEIRIYHEFVTLGSYLIVEDTIARTSSASQNLERVPWNP
ncbi:MAG: CmcI family methyltransferase [Thiotrichaceae bacterium]